MLLAVEGVVACACVEGVIALPPAEGVVVLAPFDQVMPRVAKEYVIVMASVDGVVA